VALKVFGFPGYKPYSVVLREADGGRHCVLLIRRDHYFMLRAMFESPGEPLLAHEVPCMVFRNAGIRIVSIDAVVDRQAEAIIFRMTFGFNERTWQLQVFTYDAIGYSIAGNVAISMSEEDIAFLAEMAPSLEGLGLEPADAAAESLDEATLLARELPKGKLREH